jgi:hypothetical protein
MWPVTLKNCNFLLDFLDYEDLVNFFRNIQSDCRFASKLALLRFYHGYKKKLHNQIKFSKIVRTHLPIHEKILYLEPSQSRDTVPF